MWVCVESPSRPPYAKPAAIFFRHHPTMTTEKHHGLPTTRTTLR
jgi:hypothetical protein